MQVLRIGRAPVRRILAVAAIFALSACTLPRSGPTAGEITSGRAAAAADVRIVPVNGPVAAISRSSEALGFAPEFIGAGMVSSDAISPGDTVSVTVWENVDSGLLAGVGQRVTVLEQMQVDERGQIYVPYAGRIDAGGASPETLRRRITEALEGQTPDPQVEVRRIAGDGATVSVMGGVGDQGVYPIGPSTRRLSAMLAQAGGVQILPEVAQVKVERSGRSGRVWLQDLYDDPRNDIALRAGDRIIVEEDRRSFTALGAASGQRRVNFTKRDLSLIEALAEAGGLDGRAADPTGVFVFRLESAEAVMRATGETGLIGPQRIAYVVDLTSPEGLFSAREFVVRDNDTVYVTEAPLAAWSRVLAIAGSAVNFGSSVAVLEGRI